MNHGSLFSGIGGFELAAQWMGWNNIFNCEWEEFPRQVLRHHFPESKQYGDIKEFRATAYAGSTDILTGGFPCQPYSLAGQRKGKDDERHLWPEMLRIVRECAPRYVVGENVRGLVGWNGGLVFEEVCADLEAQGYAVQPFILPACGVGAPHRRDRVWFVAKNTNGYGRNGRNGQEKSKERRFGYVSTGDNERICTDNGQNTNAPDTERVRLEHTTEPGSVGEVQGQVGRQLAHTSQAVGSTRASADTKRSGQQRQGKHEQRVQPASSRKGQADWIDRGDENTRGEYARPNFEAFPTQPPVCGGDDGIPRELDSVTFSKWRKESIKAYGNAIVPQVAYQIFKAIDQYERLEHELKGLEPTRDT